MTLRWKNHTFRLEDSGRVAIDPPLTGDESDPFTLSIKKWEFIVECLDVGCEVVDDGGYKTCGLCAKYYCGIGSRDDRAGCRDCPIQQFTGCACCINTPMTLWSSNLHTLAVAQAELYFLKALQEYYREKGE